MDRNRHRATAGVALAAALVTAACGAETPDVDDSGAIGPDEAVSDDVTVLQVQIEYPLDGVYEAGEDAELFLGIANDGTRDDTLTDVRGPDFTEARLVADGEPGVIPVPANGNVYVGAEGAPSVVLEDLQSELRSSLSIPVTLVFERAGEVTVQAVVSAERTNPTAAYDFPDPAEDPTS